MGINGGGGARISEDGVDPFADLLVEHGCGVEIVVIVVDGSREAEGRGGGAARVWFGALKEEFGGVRWGWEEEVGGFGEGEGEGVAELGEGGGREDAGVDGREEGSGFGVGLVQTFAGSSGFLGGDGDVTEGG